MRRDGLPANDDTIQAGEVELDIDSLFLGTAAPEQPAKSDDQAEVRVHSASLLRILDTTAAIEARCARLEEALERQTGELRRARDEMTAARRATQDARMDTIRRLVAAAECKDHETAAHIERIGRYSKVIARALNLSGERVATIGAAAPMHDVGKLSIPDAILQKCSPLTPAEWEIMKQHTVMGARMLEGSSSPLLKVGAVIALAHHERWDGTGYPSGLAGDDIPLEARICAVADVFDALSSDRRYREALPNDTVFEVMETLRGRQFDPRVLDAFFASRAEIEGLQAAA